ncbi:UDP-glucose--hexose-1-phosphate uridylyltransferase [Paenibacillus yanchengensis]|uniref:Galactose-1-phosphate uridylyltransferase n=1 Tax=Paenibacillus yanchengensis TaxID=2035833 RepID=A0ABW4YHH1_9BACL
MNHQEPSNEAKQQAQLAIEQLLHYAGAKLMLDPLDISDTRNQLLALFQFSEPAMEQIHLTTGEWPLSQFPDDILPLLEQLIDYGYSIGLIAENTINYRDLLDAKIMGLLLPKPSQVVASFQQEVEQHGISSATDKFYQFNIASNYIRMDRIANNVVWMHDTDYGALEITINLSKPEKDPKEIALLRTMPQAHYPKCPLCADNVGYAGRLNHPARQNLRIIPLALQDEPWYFQYSPYVYYNEHSIVFKGEHEPMVIGHSSFARLLDFVDLYPHYFIGSNADLPIVGGSILSHDHFQAGHHSFPMEKAPVEAVYRHPDFASVDISIVKWPMSVVRLNGASKQAVHAAACYILDEWRLYSDASVEIAAFTEDGQQKIPHNTITPIARLVPNDGANAGAEAAYHYELDLVLRNNRTSEQHPDGIFHPHQERHHIKKENIGLIEVMGLAVLPGRLKQELDDLAAYLTNEAATISIPEDSPLAQHAAWITTLQQQYGTDHTREQATQLLFAETGNKFLQVLEDAGVFKRTEQGQQAFATFLQQLGMVIK